ncbi:MAG TPA: hypothetical protein VG078_07035, partial [Acidimicrobiales bacterium]|nr:hypothetical protein [Acidimicrobiales bacterium]
MADGVPPASGGERTDVAARPRADDEGLRDAFAALLGLRGEDGGAAATATAVPLPPPRTASPAAPPTPEPPPANDLWAPSDAPASTGEWARPEPLDDPPPSADDFWSSTHDEHPSSAWAPADEPEPASAPSEPEPASAPGPWMAHNPERDELWAAPVADVTPATAAVEDPASADARPFELDDPRPPDLFLPAGDRGPTIPPVISLDRGDEAAAPSSLPGLQDVGLGGPLNTAMGDLRRLADDNFGRAARPPETRPGSRRASFDESVVLLQEWWAARRRELLPGLGVALLIAVAFAVVLLTRDGDAGRPVGTVSTSVAPAATAPPTLPLAEETTTVPLPEELVPAA